MVPAYNEERLIARTVTALHEAARDALESHEIVVVDDGSSDRTAAIAEQSGARVVRAHFRHIAATRNAGARAARGNLLIFVDADTVVNAGVVRAAAAAMRKGAVGGGCDVRFDGPLPRYSWWVRPLLLALLRGGRLAAGCFLFCTRQAFDAAGGFDERVYAAEEIYLSQALKKQGRFVVLKETVLSSGRKLRAYSGREFLAFLALFIRRGPRVVRSRDALDVWYRRREDPEDDQQSRAA